MKQRSKKEQFYILVGEAMSMNDMRSFINMETLEVDSHASEDFSSFEGEEDEDDPVQEALNNPGKYFNIEKIYSSQSFKIMEEFTETLTNKNLQRKLLQALEHKKPFANFKILIDNSEVRQDWFSFRDEAYAEIAREWLEDNASDELKEKIKALPSVFKAE